MIRSLINRLSKRIRENRLARNTAWMFMGQGLGIISQAAYFVLIARSLGAQNYGAFVGVCALVAVFYPISNQGSGQLQIKNVARSAETFGRYWGRAILTTLVSGMVLLILILGISRFIFSAAIPFPMIVIVAVTDLFFFRATEISAQAFQAFERLERTAHILFTPVFFRMLAIAGLSICVKKPSALDWSYLYLITTAASTFISLRLVHKELGPPVFATAPLKKNHAEGFNFAIGLSAESIYNNLDKTMLAKLSTLASTGIYGAACRIIDVSLLPVNSLLIATYAKFFQHGAVGIRGSLDFAKKIFPLAGVYGLLGGSLLMISAPLLPMILGAQYNDAATALSWLAPLPILKSIHFFAADTLTGAGFQGTRSAVQVFVALFNIGINLWLIPAYSWRGAAWASLISAGLLAILLSFLVLYRLGGHKTGEISASSVLPMECDRSVEKQFDEN